MARGIFDGSGGISRGMLIRAWRWSKANPDGVIPTGQWPTDSMTGSEFCAWAVDCLMSKLTGFVSGRKFDCAYQSDLRYDVRIINEHGMSNVRRSGRNILRTRDMQKRYPSVNSWNWEG